MPWGTCVVVAFASYCSALHLILTAVAATPASAQTFRGTILGTVTDTSGAAVLHATVTARNMDTGVDRIH